MRKLEEVLVDENGNISLKGTLLNNVFPILAPFYFNGQGYAGKWEREMLEKAPKNSRFYSVSKGEGTYLNGMEPCQFTKAYVQFYGQRDSDTESKSKLVI